MYDNVVSLRPTLPQPSLPAEAAVIRIDGKVKLGALLRGLAAEGLALKHDARTGYFVILPRE
jgi:hypothetical protein